MKLKWRLTSFFLAIVVVPLAVAGVALDRTVDAEVSRRTSFALSPALRAARDVFAARAETLDDRAAAAIDEDLARLLASGRSTALEAHLADLLRDLDQVDILIAQGAEGEVLAAAIDRPEFSSGFVAPEIDELLATEDGVGRGFVRSVAGVVRSGGRTVGRISAGLWIDNDLMRDLALEDIDVSLVYRGRLAATSIPEASVDEVRIPASGEFDFDAGTSARGAAAPIGEGVHIVVSVPTTPEDGSPIGSWILGILLIVVVLTGSLAYLLARLLVSPLEEVAEGARAIEEGRFGHQIAVRSRDEVGRLAVAFNRMSERLSETISELSTSRDQMRRSIQAVGDALRSTHDMKQILSSVITIAADAVGAEAAVLWLISPGDPELYPARSFGADAAKLSSVKIGRGVVGQVAERAASLVLPDASGPRPSAGEPLYPVAIAVPIYSKDRMRGVISVYRRDETNPFSKADIDTVLFLAQQSGVAVENVLLHEEAQRLAITDGLTGVWNRRYFSIQFRQLLATAKRFNRRFSLLMLDIDHFKRVNDEHGHQRGDAVLVELARRIQANLREVDTIARYGGEEFVVMLAETELPGAEATATKILEAIRSELFTGPGHDALRITVSIGVSSFPHHGTTLTALVDAADRALYRAKRDGRDRVVVADDESPTPGLRLAT